MKTKLLFPVFVFFFSGIMENRAQFPLFFVKEFNGNADLYYMPDVSNPSDTRQLTTNAAVDNHPEYFINPSPPYDTMVVWSTNRDGNFEIYTGTLPDLEATATRRTNNDYADRHPHFSHNGQWLIYDAKYYIADSLVCPKSQCSIPVSLPCNTFEGLRVMKVGTWTPIDIDLTDMSITGGGTWPSTNDTWVGHPSFSPDNSRIIFSAARDGGGTDWEVYTADFNTGSVSNLKQITLGTTYPASLNPIQMSAGAHFTDDGNSIFYSSTRTPLGNSQIFMIPASSIAVPVHPLNQVTWHYGNDYVPEEMDGKLIITSDLGMNICAPPDSGASMDLDIEMIDLTSGSRTNLTNDDVNNEMLLIGDEVSWFCGLKPNLSECTFYPKIWNICWWRVFHEMGTDLNYLPNFPKRDLYTRAWQHVSTYMQNTNPTYFSQMMDAMTNYSNICNYDWMQAQSWWVVPSFFGKWDEENIDIPLLLHPLNMSSLNTLTPQLNWSKVSGAGNYHLQVSDEPSFNSPIIDEVLTDTLYNIPPGLLLYDVPYYWHVSGTGISGTSLSTVWYFIIPNTIGTGSQPVFKGNNLSQNNPNPFNETSTFTVNINHPENVNINVYDMCGRETKRLYNGFLKKGKNTFTINAADFSNGIYYYRLAGESSYAVKKFVVQK